MVGNRADVPAPFPLVIARLPPRDAVPVQSVSYGMSTTTRQSPAPTSATKNTTAQSKPSAPQSHETKSASKRADEAAKRGEPLSADNPRDRSPKQENL